MTIANVEFDTYLPGEDLTDSAAWQERHGSIGDDRALITPGERGDVTIDAAGSPVEGDVVFRGPDGSTKTVAQNIYISPEEVGYFLAQAPQTAGEVDILVDGEQVGTFRVDDTDASPVGGDPVARNTDSPDERDAIDPEDYAGIVNADNSEEIALAPKLRRAGASLSPSGAMVNLPDGRTVEVAAIKDEDEVARIIDGENAGDVIDADKPATESGGTSESGDLGMAAAVAAVLVGYAATR